MWACGRREQSNQTLRGTLGADGMLHAWVGQLFFAYSPPSRPLGSSTSTQPGRVTNPTRGLPWATLWGAPQAECTVAALTVALDVITLQPYLSYL